MCVDGFGYVYECDVVLDESPSLFVFPVCSYGGVVRYFWGLDFFVSFVSCNEMMSGFVLSTRIFNSSICS